MDPEEFVRAIAHRDERIRALVAYAEDLGSALAARREEEAGSAARVKAYEEEISQLRSEHGLRAGTLDLR